MKKVSISVFTVFVFFIWVISFPLNLTGKDVLKAKVIEKQGEKKKKKFPVFLAIGAAAVVTVVVILLVKKKGTGEKGPDPLAFEWMEIPAGEFLMGDNSGIGRPDERPVHAVYLDAFKISKYEVTFDQYDYFCDQTGRSRPDNNFIKARGSNPATNMTWNDAAAYCQWLSSKLGKTIRLPTEAEWEKAARGTDQRMYPWGNETATCNFANYAQCNYNTISVGSYPSGVSPYGVHDMAGNVYEWCSDWYDPDYYSYSPRDNPQGPASGLGPVMRGGCVGHEAYNMRTTFRQYYGREWGSHNIGIRLVME